MSIVNLYKFQLKIHSKLMIGWAIVIAAMMIIYLACYPMAEDMANIDYAGIPENLMGMFGMDDMTSMGNYVEYFGIIYNLILIAISIYAVTFSSRIIYSEEKEKTIEFLSMMEVSRKAIFLSKVATVFISLIVIIILTGIVTVLCGYAVGGDTFVLEDTLKIMAITSFTPFLFMALGFFLAGLKGKMYTSTIGSIVVVISYFAGFLSTLIGEKGEWLAYLSPFEIIGPENALHMESEHWIIFAIYIALFFILIGLGTKLYNRRDFCV